MKAPTATPATMASFANSLRHLLGHGQTATSSAPEPIACFDGTSDDRIYPQQMRGSNHLHQDNDGPTIENVSAPPLTGQNEATGRDHAHQPAAPHQYSKHIQQFAVQQDGNGVNHMHGTMHPMQKLGYGGHDQYDELTQQIPPRTATAQPHGAHPYHSYVDGRPQTLQFSDTSSHASAKAQVKQEPATHEHGDHDIFAKFTNEEFHIDSARMSAETQQASSSDSNSANYTTSNAVSIKQELGSERQLPVDTTERAGDGDSTVTAGRNTVGIPSAIPDQTPSASTVVAPQTTSETSVSTSRAHSEPQYQQLEGSSGMVAHADGSEQQYSEKYAQEPRQSILDPQVRPDNDKSLPSPSADSVSGSWRHSSEETALSIGTMDLSANSHVLAQQWQERQKLIGMDALAADAVQANPILLHGPRPSQEQYVQSAPQPVPANHVPQGPPSYQTQLMDGLQRRSFFPYNMNMQNPTYSTAGQHGRAHSHWMPPGFTLGQSVLQASLPSHPPMQASYSHGSIYPQRITEVQEDENFEISDDDEPLVTRAPRHRSVTASPTTSPVDHLLTSSSSKAKPTIAAPIPRRANGGEGSIVELSDNDDGEIGEPISWKLPDFEVIYHPPATDKDLPMAKVSILGRSENLVRSEVALTEDHAHHEMELFLNVFLPAQQALQTPDAEPAHAVINFHTISVMVLEAFVQYEIGDEVGLGYGFYGGNTASRTLRPSPSSSDGEPMRTRSAKDADVDEIFFAVIDRWRAGLTSGKGTLKLIRGCQEFCDIALDVIQYVKEHGISQPEPKKRKERSDKGAVRGPRGGVKLAEAKGKATGKRKADTVERKASAKKAKKATVTELPARKKPKVDGKKKPAAKTKSSGVIVTQRKK